MDNKTTTMKPTTLVKNTKDNYVWSALDGTTFGINDRRLAKICAITRWDYDFTKRWLHNHLNDGGLWVLTITSKQDVKIKKALGWTETKRGF